MVDSCTSSPCMIGAAAISAVHPDIVQTHILTRLDGPALASAGCVSSQLHSLTTDDNLWREICTATWPSIDDPRVRQVVSTFPSGYRSFFSDSFPLFDPESSNSTHNPNSSNLATELISAVDIYYKNNVVYSGFQRTETSNDWFRSAPFRVDILDPKEPVPTPVRYRGQKDGWLKGLEENLRLSWIVIDPTRKKAVNVSSRRAVAVQRHWLTGEVQVKYSTVVVGMRGETVEVAVVVTCRGKEGGGMHVREVSMQTEDMEGRGLSGEDSLVILKGVMESRRKREGKGNEVRERYEGFVDRKREMRERKQKREKALDMLFVAIGIVIFFGFWFFILFG